MRIVSVFLRITPAVLGNAQADCLAVRGRSSSSSLSLSQSHSSIRRGRPSPSTSWSDYILRPQPLQVLSRSFYPGTYCPSVGRKTCGELSNLDFLSQQCSLAPTSFPYGWVCGYSRRLKGQNSVAGLAS